MSTGKGDAERGRKVEEYPTRVSTRLLDQIDEHELWTGSTNNSGYGQLMWIEDGERYWASVHQMVWRLANGMSPIPDDHQVHHECGKLACCRPHHLVLLTREAHHVRHHGGPTPEAVYNSNRTLKR